MKTFTAKHINVILKLPIYVAGGSFFFGTLLLMLHLISPKPEGEIYTGIIYTLAAFLLNAVFFLAMLAFCFSAPPSFRTKLYTRTALLLLNIPVAIIYIIIVINFSFK